MARRFHKKCPIDPNCLIDLKNGKELHRMMHDKISIAEVEYQHIYLASGFKISEEMFELRPGEMLRAYTPPISMHACMDFGHWCEEQIKEQNIQVYFKKPGEELKEFKLNG